MKFTLKNIHDFLLEKGYPKWNYEVYDKKTGGKRKAIIEDFDYSGIYGTTELAFVNKYGDDCNLEVYIADFAFLTYRDESNIMGSGSTTYIDKDFTNAWIDFMLNVYGEEYAKTLFKNSARNKKRIKDNIVEKVKEYTKQLKNENQSELEYYIKMEEKALTYLTDSDVVDLIETI